MARFVSHNKSDNGGNDVRNKMKSYWQVYRPSLESMMLSDEAVYLHENDQNEIFSYLPRYKDKNVLELGAGIGRFTSKLATIAGHVTSVDFMESYIEENRVRNGHHKNVTFKCADVTKVDFPSGSFDLVFSNWLFMYLSDEETRNVFHKILNWLKPDGYFFLRESCYHQSGTLKRNENPTLYRTPKDYCQMLHQVFSTDNASYKIIRGKNILTYIQYHGNPNQMCFLARRIHGEELERLGHYLSSRDTVDYIRAKERIHGHNWLSTGGELTTRDFCSRLNFAPDQKVLDVGCGTGGSAQFLARQYGVQVHGVDLSSNMIHIAIERQGKLEEEVKKRLQFEISDIQDVEYEKESYDFVYSRDSLLYIPDKDKLFKKFFRWLREGGTLFVTDFCIGNAPADKGFLNYTNRHTLMSIHAYEAELQRAGFTNIVTKELKREAIEFHEMELRAFVSARQSFMREFGEGHYNTIFNLWNDTIKWIKENQLTWCAFTAERPS